MTIPLLVEHFDELLATPEDVEQLNRAILHLAIQGKLVTQDNTDEPASEILKRIATTKSELNIKELLSPIGDDEKPFDLPKGWEWARLNDICSQITDGTHYTPKYLYDGVPFLSVKDVSKGFLDFSNTKFISHEEHEIFASRCKPELGDVILTKVGTTGIAVVVDTEKEFSIFVSLALLKFFQNEIAPKFLALVINSPFVKGLSEKYTMGVGNKNLVLKHIKSFPIPLPPLAEQQRIVARVEELFAQTRALAKELAHSQSELDGLNKSALSHLLASETPEEFNQHWDFIAEHFDLLFQTPEHVAPLRQSILELAVRGKLTRREAGDESVQILLKKIEDEKEQINGEKKTSKIEQIPPDKNPHDLPRDWIWVKVSDICASINDGDHLPPPKSESGVPFLVISNVRGGVLDFRNTRFVPKYYYDQLNPVRKPQKGDILYSIVGSLGITVSIDSDKEFCFQRHMALFRPLQSIDRRYLYLILQSPLVLNQARGIATGIAQLTIPMAGLRKILVPLPPLAEQERIVKRVEQLLSLCDALEARLQSAEEERGRLVAAVMSTVGG